MSDENTPLPIRPLHDVWLKPRRVFRELSDRPLGGGDYLLAAAQGVVSWLALSRAQSAGAGSDVATIFGRALLYGPIAGVLGIHLMAAVYARLGSRAGGASSRNAVFHVLAYSGVPMLVSLGVWVLTALLVGRATFMEKPPADLESFPALLLQAQFVLHLCLAAWGLLLQVMGFSEVQGLATRRAFAIWVLGQVLVLVALVVLSVLVYSLLLGMLPPGSVPMPK